MWSSAITATLLFNLALSLPLEVIEIITGAKTYSGPQWRPEAGAKFQITLSRGSSGGGFFNQRTVAPSSADIIDLDLFDTSKALIDQLHSQNKRVICYFSAGSSESWRTDFNQIQAKDMGEGLRNWPRERWLDIRSPDIFKIMQARIKLAAGKGCDGIDPDNVDAFGDESRRGGGFAVPLKGADTVAYVTKLANEAHQYGLAVGLKNAETLMPQLGSVVEFAVNEECATYNGCKAYQAFLNSGKPVFHIEYVHVTTSGSSVDIRADADSPQLRSLSSDQLKNVYCLQSAPSSNRFYSGNTVTPELGRKFSTVIKDMSLSPWVMYCDGSWESGDAKGAKGAAQPKLPGTEAKQPVPVASAAPAVPAWLTAAKENKNSAKESAPTVPAWLTAAKENNGNRGAPKEAAPAVPAWLTANKESKTNKGTSNPKDSAPAAAPTIPAWLTAAAAKQNKGKYSDSAPSIPTWLTSAKDNNSSSNSKSSGKASKGSARAQQFQSSQPPSAVPWYLANTPKPSQQAPSVPSSTPWYLNKESKSAKGSSSSPDWMANHNPQSNNGKTSSWRAPQASKSQVAKTENPWWSQQAKQAGKSQPQNGRSPWWLSREDDDDE